MIRPTISTRNSFTLIKKDFARKNESNCTNFTSFLPNGYYADCKVGVGFTIKSLRDGKITRRVDFAVANAELLTAEYPSLNGVTVDYSTKRSGYALASTTTGKLFLLHLATGKILFEIKDHIVDRHDGDRFSAVSPSGKYFVVSSRRAVNSRFTIYDVATGVVIYDVPNEVGVLWKFSANEKALVYQRMSKVKIAGDGYVTLSFVAGAVFPCPGTGGLDDYGNGSQITSDGQWAVTNYQLCNTTTGKQIGLGEIANRSLFPKVKLLAVGAKAGIAGNDLVYFQTKEHDHFNGESRYYYRFWEFKISDQSLVFQSPRYTQMGFLKTDPAGNFGVLYTTPFDISLNRENVQFLDLAHARLRGQDLPYRFYLPSYGSIQGQTGAIAFSGVPFPHYVFLEFANQTNWWDAGGRLHPELNRRPEFYVFAEDQSSVMENLGMGGEIKCRT